MPKEIFIAGKVDSGEETIQELASELESRGHKITFKWWEGEKLQRPYLGHRDSSNNAAKKMLEGINEGKIFILIPGEGVLGALIEFGIAIRDQQDNLGKEIIVVVESGKTHQSVYYGYEGVLVVENIDQIRQRPWY